MKQVIINETTGNPFPPQISIVKSLFAEAAPVSTEGYYHNPELIKSTAKKLAGIIGLQHGQKTIDVGYGSNLSVMEAMKELGMASYGLDSQDGLDSQRYPQPFIIPPYFNTQQNGIRKYCGTIEELLHPESQLKEERFDLFTFWGSLDSGGYSFAVSSGEWGWFRAIQEYGLEDIVYPKGGPQMTEEACKIVYEKIQETREKILRNCRLALNPDGGILAVSSRYAFHGAGFSTEQLPLEKRINLRLAQTLADMGASSVYLIGVSKPEVQRQLSAHPDFENVMRGLIDDDVLFGLEREIYETQYPQELLARIKAMGVPLGRIDAVYGRF